MNDDWGDLDDVKGGNRAVGALGSAGGPSEDAKDTSEKKRQNLFFGGNNDDDLEDLDDLPALGSNFPAKNEDKFNQVLSSTKEGGGLLASIGLKKEDVKDESMEDSEEDPHKKSDLFDTSKDRGGIKK